MLQTKERFEPRFRPVLRRMEEHEVGRPHGRMRLRNLVAGQLDARVQPIYDILQVAITTACVAGVLFQIPNGQNFTPTGGSSIVKTNYHTNMVQAGSLAAPEKLLVKNISVVLRPDMSVDDANAAVGQYVIQFKTLGKEFFLGHVQKCPGGSGTFASVLGSAITTQLFRSSTANGYPSAQNVAPITDPVPDIPGYPPITPITGVLLEQGQSFQVFLDPTLTGTTVYSTANSTTTITGYPSVGIIMWVYLEGIRLVAIL